MEIHPHDGGSITASDANPVANQVAHQEPAPREAPQSSSHEPRGGAEEGKGHKLDKAA